MSEKAGIYKNIQEHLGLLAAIVGIVTGLAGIFGYQFGTTDTTDRYQEYQQISTEKLNELLAPLPDSKKELYQPLIESMAAITNAPSSKADKEAILTNIEQAMENIDQFIKTTPILDYDVSKSPFALSVGKTVLLCDGNFSVGLPMYDFNKKQNPVLTVQKRTRRLSPGDHFSYKEGGKTLDVILMELLPHQQAVALSFKCSQ